MLCDAATNVLASRAHTGSILAAYMALRGTLPGTVEYLASSWAIVLFPFKFAVSYTILYHWLGGIRHVVWDHQKIGNQVGGVGQHVHGKTPLICSTMFVRRTVCAALTLAGPCVLGFHVGEVSLSLSVCVWVCVCVCVCVSADGPQQSARATHCGAVKQGAVRWVSSALIHRRVHVDTTHTAYCELMFSASHACLVVIGHVWA